ncbi:MAG: prefoldin subunit [Crenarchaeota archaeon]|nr:prefoldin subunit [Thermoproteota archaeon]MCR8455139.1 prefoldin subunit [Thermoproteota archaeon]MCR8487573.1 prefoldin subunit [Thermoproteota archaeon]MCR8501480.1 prefoldin subunit [Thermoproteota archaeon]
MSTEAMKLAQAKQQQILVLEEYLRLYKQRLMEIETAIRSLNKAKGHGEDSAYEILGANILVRRNIDELVTELDQEKDVLSKRIQSIEEQLIALRRELRELVSKKPEGG